MSGVQMEVLFTDLILGRKLGQGACSSVYAATHRTTGEQYAVKMFNVYDKVSAVNHSYIWCSKVIIFLNAFVTESREAANKRNLSANPSSMRCADFFQRSVS
jgi:serine/threonine protein kinase